MMTMFQIESARRVAAVEVDLFAAELRGQVLRPGEAAYDDARVLLSGRSDDYPALMARCADADDVRCAQDFARRHRLPIAVRGGRGKPAVGRADGALLIDLSPLRQLVIDPIARVARVGAGVCPAEFAAATSDLGLMSDQLLAAEVLLADGRCLRVSQAAHPYFLRCLRAGVGNLGIVMAFKYRLRSVG